MLKEQTATKVTQLTNDHWLTVTRLLIIICIQNSVTFILFCSEKKHKFSESLYQRHCWWRYGTASSEVYWAAMQRYWRTRNARICSIMHCILTDWNDQCMIVMCGDDKPFYLGHLNTCEYFSSIKFSSDCTFFNSYTRHSRKKIHRQPFPFFLSFWTTHFLSGIYSISSGGSVVCSLFDSNSMSHLLMSHNQTVDTPLFTTFRLPNITASHPIGCNT